MADHVDESASLPNDKKTGEPMEKQSETAGNDDVSKIKIEGESDPQQDKPIDATLPTVIPTTTSTDESLTSSVTTTTTATSTAVTTQSLGKDSPQEIPDSTGSNEQCDAANPGPDAITSPNSATGSTSVLAEESDLTDVKMEDQEKVKLDEMTSIDNTKAPIVAQVPEGKEGRKSPVKTSESLLGDDIKDISLKDTAVKETATKEKVAIDTAVMEAEVKESTVKGATRTETDAKEEVLMGSTTVQKPEDDRPAKKDSGDSSITDVVIKQEVHSPQPPSPPSVKDEGLCKSEDIAPKSETDSTETVAPDVPKVDKEGAEKEIVSDQKLDNQMDLEVKGVESQIKDQNPVIEESTTSVGVLLNAVKIEENKASVELTVEATKLKEIEDSVVNEKPAALPSKSEDVVDTSGNEPMQVDEATPAPITVPDEAVQKKETVTPETTVAESKAESKAVHEIIAEQSVRADREGVPLPSAQSEKIEDIVTSEVSVPTIPDTNTIPETKVEIKDIISDDWDIPASDEEEDDSQKPEGPGDGEEKKEKRVGVKRGYWEPPAEVIVELYRRLDKEGILELSWKCPGRRPPSEEGDKEEEQELPEEEINEEEMEISQEEEDPTEFDFDIDIDLSAKKMTTPRRGIGIGQAQGSGKKRVARMDKVLSDIFRHRKIDTSALEPTTDDQTSKEDAVAKETEEAMDTTTAPVTNAVTPNRPPDKFHIRSDLT